jgi:hypothetical protein
LIFSIFWKHDERDEPFAGGGNHVVKVNGGAEWVMEASPISTNLLGSLAPPALLALPALEV